MKIWGFNSFMDVLGLAENRLVYLAGPEGTAPKGPDKPQPAKTDSKDAWLEDESWVGKKQSPEAVKAAQEDARERAKEKAKGAVKDLTLNRFDVAVRQMQEREQAELAANTPEAKLSRSLIELEKGGENYLQKNRDNLDKEIKALNIQAQGKTEQKELPGGYTVVVPFWKGDKGNKPSVFIYKEGKMILYKDKENGNLQYPVTMAPEQMDYSRRLAELVKFNILFEQSISGISRDKDNSLKFSSPEDFQKFKGTLMWFSRLIVPNKWSGPYPSGYMDFDKAGANGYNFKIYLKNQNTTIYFSTAHQNDIGLTDVDKSGKPTGKIVWWKNEDFLYEPKEQMEKTADKLEGKAKTKTTEVKPAAAPEAKPNPEPKPAATNEPAQNNVPEKEEQQLQEMRNLVKENYKLLQQIKKQGGKIDVTLLPKKTPNYDPNKILTGDNWRNENLNKRTVTENIALLKAEIAVLKKTIKKPKK